MLKEIVELSKLKKLKSLNYANLQISINLNYQGVTLRFFFHHKLRLLWSEFQNGRDYFNKRRSICIHVTAQILLER